MKYFYILLIIILVGIIFIGIIMINHPLNGENIQSEPIKEKIKLPEPKYEGNISVEEAIHKRRSVRSYSGAPLLISEISQLLWSAQGITDSKWGLRTAPSAGALYPLEIYIIVGNAIELNKGIYKYDPQKNELLKIADGDKRNDLASAALGQSSIVDGAVCLVFTAIFERTTVKYGDRGIKYVYIEAGHSAQNVYLQAYSLGLGAVVIGAFYDEKIQKVLNIPSNEIPLYIMPIGRK